MTAISSCIHPGSSAAINAGSRKLFQESLIQLKKWLTVRR